MKPRIERLLAVALLVLAACGDPAPAATAADAGLGGDAGAGAHDSGSAADATTDVDAGIGRDAGEVDAGQADSGLDDAGEPPPPPGPHLLDAALTWGNGKLYFFRGDEYVRYDWAADAVDPGYPMTIASGWPGLFERDLDAAFAHDGKVHFFRGDQYLRWDIAADQPDPGYPQPIADAWPGLFPRDLDAALPWGEGRVRFVRGAEVVDWDLAASAPVAGPQPLASVWPGVWETGVDAALSVAPDKNYLFEGREYRRWNWQGAEGDPGYPRLTACWWPGLWNPYDGTGHPDENLPDAVAALLEETPSAEEVAARKARVAASITDGWEDLSGQYPLYLASIEQRLGAWGCLLLHQVGTSTYRFRCASDTAGVRALAIEPLDLEYVDWRRAAYHTEQVSQGDFLADAGTPLSIFRADGGQYWIDGLYSDPPTGSISGGFRVKVRFLVDGAVKRIQFSHLNTAIPAYVLEAYEQQTPLPVGRAFGFLGYTGNLWIGAPPAVDGPYAGNGEGLPDAHAHVWFEDQPENHQQLAPWTREALDYCGAYPYGGG